MLRNHRNEQQQPFSIHPSMRIGYVSLNVSDIQRSLEFYQSILGFRVLGRPSNDNALLSSAGNSSSHLVELLQIKDKESRRSAAVKSAGLYHFAILLPERKYLADMLQNLSDKRDQMHFDGLADHLVSESIYIRDPDFNGIEIYHDRPYSEWKWSNGNQLQMATLPLNTDDLLKESTEKRWKEMPAKTGIGHVHLYVRNLSKAMKYYNEILGLNLTATYPGVYFFAAGRYHHHIATNTWLGTNIRPAEPDALGLNHFGLELPSREAFDEIMKHVSQYDAVNVKEKSSSQSRLNLMLLQDTDGITIRIYARDSSRSRSSLLIARA
jgi:catechol 2,3-dioxygenase